MKFTNNNNLSLPLAVWLAHDDYDFIPGEKTISATSLLKPIRQVILERRIPKDTTVDIIDRVASAYGSSVHSGIERAWLNYQLPRTLKALNVAQPLIDNLHLNPDEPTREGPHLDVWIEKRSERKYKGWTISGKFDMVINGHLYDNKSTSVWTYILGSRKLDYELQCSIYKWLNPTIIEGDTFTINYIFTDWSRLDAIKKKEGYPQAKVVEKEYPFFSNEEVEKYIDHKLFLLDLNKDTPEHMLPECTDEELWRSPTKYKYFSSPEATRCSKAFDNAGDAYMYLYKIKSKGLIKEVKGEVKRCKYCSCWDICQQRRRYFDDELNYCES